MAPLAGGGSGRAGKRCLPGRPPQPPPPLAPAPEREEEAPILAARAQTNLGPARLVHVCRRPASTIWKVLRRHGCSRRAAARGPSRTATSGPAAALIHVDTARLARFEQPGHRPRGRAGVDIHANAGLGTTYLHVVVDDASRDACAQQHADERASTCAAFLTRALAHFRERSASPRRPS